MDRENMSRHEEVLVEHERDHKHQERIIEDIDAERRQNVSRAAQLIWLLFAILEALIGLRFIFKLIAANSGNSFVTLVYSFTEPFLWPFFGITGTPTAKGHILEVSSLIAMLIYGLIGWIVVRLFWVFFYHPSTRRVITYDQDDR